jgi:hypothetical protein
MSIILRNPSGRTKWLAPVTIWNLTRWAIGGNRRTSGSLVGLAANIGRPGASTEAIDRSAQEGRGLDRVPRLQSGRIV